MSGNYSRGSGQAERRDRGGRSGWHRNTAKPRAGQNMKAGSSRGPFSVVLSTEHNAKLEEEKYLVTLNFDAADNSPSWSFGLELPDCRACEGLKPSDLLKVSFAKLEVGIKARAQFVESVLKNGVKLGSKRFHYFGCSQSGLREGTAYMLNRSVQDIDELIGNMGNFDMATSAKMTKRIGLLFSQTKTNCTLDSHHVEEIPDVFTVSGALLTDGCGFMSKKLLDIISRKAKGVHVLYFRKERYKPSVIQFRYQGYKGVLSLQTNMPNGIWIQCRPSMKKFKGSSSTSFGVVKASKPYSFGALNAEYVTLLYELGISKETLMEKQSDHFKFLSSAFTDPEVAFDLFTYHDAFAAAERLVQEGLTAVQSEIRGAVSKELKSMLDKRGRRRVRIIIPESRLLYGVAEPKRLLGPDEVFVRITANGLPQTLTGGFSLVSRNPCLHPGDMRKLKVVDVPEYHHLVDCVVFSTHHRLERSHADEMSGGDLDGDEFMVIFDRDLIPTVEFRPYDYPPAQIPKTEHKVGRLDLVRYFAKFNNSSLGQVKNLYLEWVKAKGADSWEALNLNALFSSCVDGQPIQIPDNLKLLPNTDPDKRSIIEVLTSAAETLANDLTISCLRRNIQASKTSEMHHESKDLLGSLIFSHSRFEEISQFEMLRLIQRTTFTSGDGEIDHSLLAGIDFHGFTVAQRRWTLEKYPKLKFLLKDEVYQSALLGRNDIDLFHLSKSFNGCWRRLYSSESDSRVPFGEAILSSMSSFSRKLLVIDVDDRLTVCLQFEQPLEEGMNILEKSAHVFSTSTGYFRSTRELRSGQYQLDLTQQLFQVYKRGPKQQMSTFLWMSTRPSAMDDVKSNVFGRVSIDLPTLGNKAEEKFNLITKRKINRAEIFVICDELDPEVRQYNLQNDDLCTKEVVEAGSTPRVYRVKLRQDFLGTGPCDDMLTMYKATSAGPGQESAIPELKEDQLLQFLQICHDFHMNHIAVDASLIFLSQENTIIDELKNIPELSCALAMLNKLPDTQAARQCLLRSMHNYRQLGTLPLELITESIEKSPDLWVDLLEFLAVTCCVVSVGSYDS